MIALTVKILLAYALGSVSGSLIIGRLRHVDIRQQGSGNAGGTNALRTQGFLFALGVVIIDVGKGALAAGMVPALHLPGLNDPVSATAQAVACAAAAVFGHCYPVWHGFRGGKGAATAVGTLCVLQPLAIGPMLGVWLLVLILTGWVGLATMAAAVSLVPAMVWLEAPGAHLAYAAFIAAFLVFTHRGNIRKLRAGKEHRFQRAMLRNWFR